MAKLNKTILGKVSGALGDITFRQRNGKNFLSTRPGSFVPGQDPASVARRQKFALSIQLAKAINSISELKSVWSSVATPGTSAYNQMMRANYPMISPTDISGLIKLVPSLGFNVTNPTVTLGPSEITANTDAIGNLAGIDPTAEPSTRLVSVVYLSNPSDDLVGAYTFLTFNSEVKDTDLTSALSFTFTLSDVETQLFAKYQDKKGFFVLLTLDATGKVVHYSNTFTG